MKEKIFINARIIDPSQKIDEIGSLILNEKGKVVVYFPHSYNFSGELFIVPKERVKALDVNSSELMKFVVSAGLSGWKKD